MKTLIMVTLCLASNYLGAMTAGQKLMRMVIGDCVRASQQKPQAPEDYDYELMVEREVGFLHQAIQITEKCRKGQVAGKLLTINTSTVPSFNPLEPDHQGIEASRKSYYGAVGSQELAHKIISAGTCATADKVCSPAGMCICTDVFTHIWRNELKKK